MLRLPESEFVIYSQRALCSIGNPFCHHPLIRGIHRWLRSLRDRGKTAHFCWAPSHDNIAGNEEADLEIVAPANTHRYIGPTFLPERDYYSHFSAALRNQWLASWQNIDTNKLRTVKNSVSAEYLLSKE